MRINAACDRQWNSRRISSLLVLMWTAALLLCGAVHGQCPHRDGTRGSGGQRRSAQWQATYSNGMAAAQWSELRSAVYSRVAARGFGAAVVRLAWTDASSFGNNTNNTTNTNTNTTNSGGAHAQNVALKDDNGLGEAVALLAPLAQSYALSTADLWSFAAAVVVANSGGPSIKWRPGRADAVDALDAPFPVFGGTSPVRLKPDFTAKDIRNAFANRMGFTDRETVALMGAHSMGIAKLNNTGYSGAWTLTPSYLSNQYFVQLSLNTTYNLQSITALDNSTKTQYVNSRGLMLLPSDMALTQDASYLAIVQEYATDQTLFLNDFGSAFTKLLELGLPPPATASGLPPVQYVDTVIEDPNSVASALANSTSSPTDPSVSSNASDANTICHPPSGTAVFCVHILASGSNTVYTVHSVYAGWVGFGVGSNTMSNGDVIVGWKNSTGDAWTQTFTTRQHNIALNQKTAWQQVALSAPPPSWAQISFSAIHPQLVLADTDLYGNSDTGQFIFAASSVVPAGHLDRPAGVLTLYQHDVSGSLSVKSRNGIPTSILGATPIQSPNGTNVNSASVAVDPGNTSFAKIMGIAFGVVAVIALFLTFCGIFYFRQRIPKKDLMSDNGIDGRNSGPDETLYATLERNPSMHSPRAAIGSPLSRLFPPRLNQTPQSAATTAQSIRTKSTLSLDEMSVLIPSNEDFLAMRPMSSIFMRSGVVDPTPLTLANLNALDAEKDSDLFRALAMAQINAVANRATTTTTRSETSSVQLERRPTTTTDPSLDKQAREAAAVAREFALFKASVQDLRAAKGVNPQPPARWTCAEVAAWVLANGAAADEEETMRIVMVEKISGRVLVASTVADLLRVLRVEAYGDRVLFNEAFRELKAAVVAGAGGDVIAVGELVEEEPPLYLG